MRTCSDLAPDEIAEHYLKNWEDEPIKLEIEEYADFTNQRNLILEENEMIRDL
jgi:hypothetical protein